MSKINTGGPAFPSGLIDPSTPEDAVQSLHNGMTMRDYFAAKAMQGLMDAAMPMSEIAQAAYQMADDMLKARKQ
jgi:hypothetical protein